MEGLLRVAGAGGGEEASTRRKTKVVGDCLESGTESAIQRIHDYSREMMVVSSEVRRS